MTVQAVAAYRDNGDLIEAARDLRHLRAGWSTLDATHEFGVFWSRWRPDRLVRMDVAAYARKGGGQGEIRRLPIHLRADARRLPFPDRAFAVVVDDPPYGLRGTVNDSNGGYGLGEYMTVDGRHQMMREMAVEAGRIASERVLYKCQDQVCNGELYWQTDMITAAMAVAGWRKAEELQMAGGGRPQPERRRWHCLACGKGDEGSVGPRHQCRQAADKTWNQWKASRIAAGESYTAPDVYPWLASRPSPQGHAANRPSSLLIFERT